MLALNTSTSLPPESPNGDLGGLAWGWTKVQTPPAGTSSRVE
jgi:hypothetical protein